jgi:hypothetical protein
MHGYVPDCPAQTIASTNQNGGHGADGYTLSVRRVFIVRALYTHCAPGVVMLNTLQPLAQVIGYRGGGLTDSGKSDHL